MDSKKVIEKLVRIAANQQKIINKLAQQAAMQPPAQGLAPATPTHDVIAKLQEVAPDLMNLVEMPNSRVSGTDLLLKFKPGATQNTVQAIQAKVNELVNKNLVAGGPFVVKPI